MVYVKEVTMMCVCVTGSKPPPDNSLTEAPTDPDGRSSGMFLVTCECAHYYTLLTAGVVIGVVVGIVVLSLSIAAAGMIEISSMLFYGCMMKLFSHSCSLLV